jgi:hypothetical protein
MKTGRITICDEKEAERFFQRTISMIVNGRDARAKIERDEIGHKAAVLSSLIKNDGKGPSALIDTLLSCKSNDFLSLLMDWHISASRRVPGLSEELANELLFRTGFFKSRVLKCGEERFAILTRSGIKLYLLASAAEKQNDKRRILKRSAFQFRLWQELLRQLEVFLREEISFLVPFPRTDLVH